jgi:hypothetical protein
MDCFERPRFCYIIFGDFPRVIPVYPNPVGK